MKEELSKKNYQRTYARGQLTRIMIGMLPFRTLIFGEVHCTGGSHSASAFSTLFSWNNETLNAWTIIMGVWVTIAGMLYTR